MSASNWTICPKCGNPDGKEYDNWTLREDWELGIRNKKFYIRYSGSCKKCGFKKDFIHKEKLTEDSCQ